ncbi:MAG: hypothetical protein F6J98_21140 [Moorea sp. SIO4G2]|uniref:hypothetical protein n=1 Tax=unclassified Moorena TaxID=2683338 RepID=UPI0013B702B7|nr:MULTISPECIES: hypothetical protein [unclassified Moorena]NEO62804.1 hypothetical protein [Moorena sp. SIO4G2]NEQ80787.1 hypothetical protein [Moorena sp. SIO2I5]NEO15064.1 hypothetical protein [Moorena sp. SIO3E8]NEP27115.1 hypothetical protein [Moorena sp. SIO3I6]NEQ01041.1 hypothetical protein [Moorena sp. SIO3F7]
MLSKVIRLLVLPGLVGVSWLTTVAIVPQSAEAKTARINVTLNREPDETYQGFMRRAEVVARAAAQRSFDSDILTTKVAITILGQNQGEIAPVLLLEVSRPSWQRRPDAKYWATYFPNTQFLLRVEEPDFSPQSQPQSLEPASPSPQEPPANNQAPEPPANNQAPEPPPANNQAPEPPANNQAPESSSPDNEIEDRDTRQ